MDRQLRTKKTKKQKTNALERKKEKEIAAREMKRENKRIYKKLKTGMKKSLRDKKLKKLDRELKKLGKKINKEKKKMEKEGGADVNDEGEVDVEHEKTVNNDTEPMEVDKNMAKAGQMLGVTRSPLKDLNQLGQVPPWRGLKENNQGDKMPDKEEDFPILSPVYEGDSDYDSDRTQCYSPSTLNSLPVQGHSSVNSSNEPTKSNDDESNDATISDIELDDGDGTDEWLPGDDDDNSSNASHANINKLHKSKVKSSDYETGKKLNNVTNIDVLKCKTDTHIEDDNDEVEAKVKSTITNDFKSLDNSSTVTHLKDVTGSCLTISSDIDSFKDRVNTGNDENSDIVNLSNGTNTKLDHKLIVSDVTKLKDVKKYHSISSDAEMLVNDMKTVKDHAYLPDSGSNQEEIKKSDVANNHNTIGSEMEVNEEKCLDDELPEVKFDDSDATEPYSDSDMDAAKFRRFFSFLNHGWEDVPSSDSEESEVDQDELDEALIRLLGRPSSSRTPARSEGSTRGRKRKAPLFPPKPSKRARRNWGSEDDYCSDGSDSSLPDIGMMNEIHKVMQGTSSKRDDKKSNKVKIPNALEEDEEEYGVAEVYDDYMPLKLKLGCQHPDPVVETASLASVEPTDITYQLGLPEDTIAQGKLSALQLEAIVYSSQAHEQTLPDGSRAGFLIGDGAGVGKGRTVAGVIFENYLQGRKRAVWVSISNDLKLDAERDLSDIGAPHIKVHLLKDFKYVKLSGMNSVSEGVMFMTYTALSSKGGRTSKDSCFKSRIDQLLNWCGQDFDGVIVLDECHKAKNLCPPGGKGKPTKTGLNIYKLQEKLPKARLVYASATGATEPKNMAYMVRLGLWGKGTAFDSFSDFIKVVEKGGVGAMEIVAMDMKLRGMYIARQLSFRGVSFKIEEVPLEDSLMKVYNDSVELWVEAKQQFDRAFDISGADPKMKRFMWAQFWGAHQRFFKYLCIAAKVDRAVAIAQQAVAEGKCAVIGLQSTGEARTLVQLGQQTEELTEFLSTAEGVFKNLVETQFPGVKVRPRVASVAAQLDRMQQAMLTKIEELGARLPRNMLDDLVDKLGGAEKVAEMTGRKGRLVKSTENGQQQVHYESRCDGDATLDTLNVLEKQRFMSGDKVIAVISEAASSGISLQSDRRVENQRRRVHITIELPWSADRAIQQFGRTHRCNQVNAPEYIFLISDLAGERRFASTVAKRLESLGALTHGDRRATETRDLSQFNVDNKYGKEALLALLQAVRGGVQRGAAPAGRTDFTARARQALEDVGLVDPDEGAYAITDQGCNMSKFLNRILGVPVAMQNCLFKYFVDNLTMVTEEAKRKGSFDQGIVDVKGARCVCTLRALRQHATGLAPVLLHTVLVDRGMDWESALRKYNAESGAFYVARQGCGHRRNILLYVGERGQTYRPGTGLQRAEPLADIQRKYQKLSGANWMLQAETLWTRNHLEAKTVCSHAFFRTCQPGCKWGLRERIYYVLAGSVLAVWDKLEFQRMQVVRVRTLNANRIVGTLIPASCVDAIEKSLKTDAVSVETKKY